MNTYFFTHWLETKEILIECCASTLEQAKNRLSKALHNAPMKYHGWILGTSPQLYMEELSHRQDPICKEYPSKASLYPLQDED